MEGKRELDGLVEGKILEVGNGLVGDFRSAKCLLSLGACLLDTAKNGVSPAPFKFNNSDEKMGANLFTTVSIAVALEGSAGKAASAAGRKIAGGAKKVLPKFLRKIGKRPPIKTGCFQAGTLVDTPDGKIEIEDLEVGDWVWAHDFNSDQHVARRIEHLIPAKTKAWVHLHTDAGEIVATPGHDFWVVTEERWVDAQDLLPEMGLLRSDGKITYIISLDLETLEVEEPTYNFEVEQDHDYYVGDSGVLVHNIECESLGDLTMKEIAKIQEVVDTAGRPLDVVGSAARGQRRGIGTDLPIGKGMGTKSDIDFTTANANYGNFQGLESLLPDADPITPLLRGYPDGPSIRFEPGIPPVFINKK